LKFLLDTNIWLEIFLKQSRSFEAKSFLNKAPAGAIFLTDFSLYSIGISLFDSKQFETFLQFAEDIMVRGMVGLIRNEMMDLEKMALVSKKFNLDFDDAYQYVAAEKYDLAIVSFDSDFDRTERGRKTPGQIIKKNYSLAKAKSILA